MRPPLPRWVNYEKEGKLRNGVVSKFESNFQMIRIETSPVFMVIYCALRDGSMGRGPGALKGLANWDNFAGLFTGSEEFSAYDEQVSNVLSISSSAASGLGVTFSARQLYELYKTNLSLLCPGCEPARWHEWKSGRGCVVLLKPADLGETFPPQSVYKPSVFSCKIAHCNFADKRSECGNTAVELNYVTRLCFCYADDLVISSGSCSVSSTLVSSQQMSASGGRVEAPGAALEKMQVREPGY